MNIVIQESRAHNASAARRGSEKLGGSLKSCDLATASERGGRFGESLGNLAFMRTPERHSATVDTVFSDFSSLHLSPKRVREPDEVNVPQYDPPKRIPCTLSAPSLASIGKRGEPDRAAPDLLRKKSLGDATATTTASTTPGTKSRAGKMLLKSFSTNMSSLLSKIEMQREAAKYMLDLMALESSTSTSSPSNVPPPNKNRLPFILPSTIQISAHKSHEDQLSGLILSLNGGNELGTVVVKDMTPTSIFANSSLKSGHEILTINDHRVKCPQRAAKIMRGLVGDVTLLISEGGKPPGTRYIRVKMSKSRHGSSTDGGNWQDEPNNITQENVGIKLETREGMVRVMQLDPAGSFGNSSVEIGDIVLTVNKTVVQNESHAMRALLLGEENANSGVICMLVYSMVDLRVGLVSRLISSPWNKNWSEDFQNVIISRPLEDGRDVSFILRFQHNWECQCNDPTQLFARHESPQEKYTWVEIFNFEVQPVISKINEAITTAAKCMKEAIEAASTITSPPPCNIEEAELNSRRRQDMESHREKNESHSTQPIDETDDETTSSHISQESSDDMIPVHSVPVAEGSTPFGTVKKELTNLQQKYHPRKVKLVDTYEDNIYVHMIVELEDSS